MKINLKDLNDKIENQDYIQDLETVKYADISKSKSKIKPYAEKMVKEVVAAFKHDSLVQTQLLPLRLRLTSSICLMPTTRRLPTSLKKGKNMT